MYSHFGQLQPRYSLPCLRFGHFTVWRTYTETVSVVKNNEASALTETPIILFSSKLTGCHYDTCA